MSLPHRLLGALIPLCCGLALAQDLPPEVAAALARAKVPLEAVSLLVADAEGEGQAPARLSHRAGEARNPASVMKLVTTYAALDLLGPAFSWRTPVYVDGVVRDGILYGDLYLKGQGDPKLVVERLWLLLRRVQGLGIQKIAGDIVLDRSAFEALEADPGGFDGEPLRPYNTAPDALLLNFKSVVMTFVPDRFAQIATVQYEPPLAGVQTQAWVPLSGGNGFANGGCGDYRAALMADFSDAGRIRFNGSYPAGCAEKVWALAYADPSSYSVRAVEGLWRAIGGQLGGAVREGLVPVREPALAPVFEVSSPPLAELIRDINKYSNNVMAQQLFLSLSLPPGGFGALKGPQDQPLAVPAAPVPASYAGAQAVLYRWWRERISPDGAPVLDNGAGLSRQGRISAQALAFLLQSAYRSPLMPELMASLPIAGVDGTLRRARAMPEGRAHLKTGSLRDVTAVAGYVHAASGRRYVLVALVNHANAYAARPAIDALVDWAVRDN